MSLSGVKALAFDTGGTVLNWHSGICSALAKAGARHGLTRDWPVLTNDYRRRSLQRVTNQKGPKFNIDDVHRTILDELVEEYDLGVFSESERASIARQWHSLDVWPDFPAALERLRSHYIVVSFTILSVSLIIDTARRNRLHWDAVISCEMLDVYKPLPEAYERAARLLQLEPREILMVACHNFDLDAARGVGYRTGFVLRPDEWGPVRPPDPVPNPANRMLLTHRKLLQSKAIAVDNDLRGTLRNFGLKVGMVGAARFEARIKELIENFPDLAVLVEPRLVVRRVLREQLGILHCRLLAVVRDDDVCRRLMTVPGVGPVVALTYRATIDVPARFRKSKSVGAVFGLTCSKYQSGEIDRSGRISRCGDEMMRTMLYEAAQSMLRSKKWCWLN